MFSSRPSVHPVEAPPLTDVTENHPPRVRMKDIQGMPGTSGGLALRFFQFMFAAAALGVMVSANDFSSVTSFRLVVILRIANCNFSSFDRYLVAAAILQSLWSLSLALLDVYALLVKRSLRNPLVNVLFAIGDGITSTLTFAAACASAGITVLIGNDLNICSQNHCTTFETATAMAFISWFAVSPSFLLNFWSLASR
ncbi:CASP-like protein 2 [Dendrobium catenatum]|uniref:CASP-like protein n=1 Tax=Dendrobium catenatum TaxID=906689 RepID=A0A2I0VIT1_9ASPA|nr:CASP-like protein 2 [Dendrobium catenatum]